MLVFIILVVVGVMLLLALSYPSVFAFMGQGTVDWLSEISKTYFWGSMDVSVGLSWQKLFAIAGVIVFAAVVSKACTLINKKLKFKNKRMATFKVLALNSIKYMTVIVAVCYSLNIVGVNMVAILASLGVMGLVVGFGAQTLIEDVITGLFIVFEGQFCVGDIVSADGYRGTVTNIGIRTTCITDVGGNVKILRNSEIKNVVNLSGKSSFAVVNMSIAYSESIERAEMVIKKALPIIYANNIHMFEGEPSYVGVDMLGPSSVDLRVVAPVSEKNVFNARRLLNRELKIAFDENSIEIPFPQMTVWQGSDGN